MKAAQLYVVANSLKMKVRQVRAAQIMGLDKKISGFSSKNMGYYGRGKSRARNFFFTIQRSVNPSQSYETFSCHSRSFVAFLEMWNFTPIKKLMSNNDDTGNEMATMAYRWVANSEDQMAKCFTNERNTN